MGSMTSFYSSFHFLFLFVFVFFFLIILGFYFLKKMAAKSSSLKLNEQYYQALFNQNPNMVLIFDVEGKILKANNIVETFGYTEKELIHQPLDHFIAPDQLENTMEHLQRAFKGKPINYETAILDKSGNRIEISLTNVPIAIDGNIVGAYGIFKDITNYKRTREELIIAESKYRCLVEGSLVGIYIVKDSLLVYVNQKMIDIIGYSESELLGKNISDFIFHEDRLLVEENIKSRLLDPSRSVHYQYRAIKKDGTVAYLENYGSTTTYEGKIAIIGAVVEVTERKKAEETIEYMAYHDELTGLLNRYHFCLRLEASLLNSSVKKLALLFINLDQFKLVNDAMGHDIGDRLLYAAAERLKNLIHIPGDIARNGGDEFLVSLPNFNRDDASGLAQEIITAFQKPFYLDQYELYITSSIGISLYPNDGSDIEDLIKKADFAMIHAKRNRKSSYHHYSKSQQAPGLEQLEMEMGLRKALEREEFVLHYQPKFDLTSGKIVGAETLIRWNHPVKGIIPPGEFIPSAEKMGLIIPIGEWVLRMACVQAMEWQRLGIPPFIISVNLSVRQLYQPNLVEMVGQILKETGLHPNYLELEITESMMVDSNHALKVLTDLRNLGVKISLDDFGTGYSSLHYLKKAPFDKLKIDQSFVRHCTLDSNDATIVKTIIAMAHQLKLEVIAEGVETKEHLIFLQKNLCNEGQGFLFSKPLKPDDFVQRISEMEQIVSHYGIPRDLQNQKWQENALEIARQELLDTIRQQQGVTFKFIKEGDRFIHTLCDGELLYRLGLVPEQIIGRELKDYQSLHEAERKAQYYRRAWDGEKNISYEAESNGISYITSLRPVIRGGEVVEVIGSCIDITERKAIEEALRLSESNYRLITENMSDLVGVWDVKGKVTYSSPSHETILGISSKNYHGKLAFGLIHPEDRSSIQEQFFQSVSSNTPFQVEFRCKSANDDWIHLEANGTPVLGRDGKVEHVVIVGRDISERKKMDEFIRKSEKLSVVGQLAAGVAHEVRNPLTSIKGFLQIIQKEGGSPQYIDIMLAEIGHVEGIIKEFLTLAKPQAKKMSPIDSRTLVGDVVRLFESQAILNNVEIVQEHDFELPFIYCDNGHIKQVFINILQNAVEAMSDGGVIKIQTMRCGGDMIKFRFIDQGHGIAEDRLKKIGEPFYSTKEKGTGLGLMVSDKIVQEHGGTLNIQSKVDCGTTVDIILPINQATHVNK